MDTGRCLPGSLSTSGMSTLDSGFTVFKTPQENGPWQNLVSGVGGSLCNAQAGGPHTDLKRRNEGGALISEEAGQLQAENLGLDIPQPPSVPGAPLSGAPPQPFPY